MPKDPVTVRHAAPPSAPTETLHPRLHCSLLQPFWGRTDGEIFKRVLNEPLDLDIDPWPEISKPAKDLVARCVRMSPLVHCFIECMDVLWVNPLRQMSAMWSLQHRPEDLWYAHNNNWLQL